MGEKGRQIKRFRLRKQAVERQNQQLALERHAKLRVETLDSFMNDEQNKCSALKSVRCRA